MIEARHRETVFVVTCDLSRVVGVRSMPPMSKMTAWRKWWVGGVKKIHSQERKRNRTQSKLYQSRDKNDSWLTHVTQVRCNLHRNHSLTLDHQTSKCFLVIWKPLKQWAMGKWAAKTNADALASTSLEDVKHLGWRGWGRETWWERIGQTRKGGVLALGNNKGWEIDHFGRLPGRATNRGKWWKPIHWNWPRRIVSMIRVLVTRNGLCLLNYVRRLPTATVAASSWR